MEEKKQKNKLANEVGTKGAFVYASGKVFPTPEAVKWFLSLSKGRVPDLRFGSAPNGDFAKSDTVAIFLGKGYSEHQNEVCACGMRTPA